MPEFAGQSFVHGDTFAIVENKSTFHIETVLGILLSNNCKR